MKNPLIVMFDAVGKERVKGISFHPRRPWILASDGQGDVELWDYRLQVLIHHYKGAHAGPVRAVQFHATQPIFVTCGDDHLVKVWNYQQHKCVFVLHGHSDYVRSVAFHHEYPWIASGSDDNLVKIWNWQSRTCIATLPGHASYVMCVRFHPVSDLLASASLDGTVRIWNFSSLAQEQLGRCASNNGPRVGAGVPFGVRDFTAPGGERPLLQPIQCHTPSRLNFVAFHPTKPLFVTAADDSDVRLWQLNGDSVRHVDAFVGHTKHATAAVFHPTRDLIVSCAEDASVRVWESDRSAQPIVVQRDNNKCWIVDVHPTQHIFAVGHEKGFFVFKLSHDRPAFCTDTVLTKATATAPATASVTTYLYREGKIFESSSTAPGQERAVATVRSLSRPENPALAPRGLQYNAANRNQQCFLLLNPDNTYELHISAPAGQAPLAPLKGYAKSAVFVSSTRFVTLDKNRTVLLKSLKNEVKRRIVVPGAHQLFPAGIGRVLVRCSDSVLLLDVHALRPIAELPLSARHPIEHAVWSPDQRHVALWSRTHVYVATAKLELVAQASESARVKSAAWDPTGVLIYCTSSQLKYLLPSGDKGVLRSVDEPVYLTSANNAEVSFLTRLQKSGRLTVNSVEYQFKLALLRHRSKDVARLMQSKLLIGQSIVAYVQRKGYPEIAMHFVHDVRLRFALALECGNVEIAKEAASEINETACWQQLGSEALRHGAYDVRFTDLIFVVGDGHFPVRE
jgi:coatomer protein complex subunit alpha (xenin)